MDFTISGGKYTITKEKVTKRTAGVVPAPTDSRNKYFVRLHDKDYPIKQVLELVINRPVAEFTAHTAYSVLTRLGFEVDDRSDSRVSFAGVPSRNGDTVNLLVTFEEDEDGWTVASCPSLPGCHSQGRTKKEATENIQEAIRGYLASMREREEPMPSSTDYTVFQVKV